RVLDQLHRARLQLQRPEQRSRRHDRELAVDLRRRDRGVDGPEPVAHLQRGGLLHRHPHRQGQPERELESGVAHGAGDRPEPAAECRVHVQLQRARLQLQRQSSDPDGSVTSWQWTFGDGTSGSTAQNPSHTYSAGGSYTVTLTVKDNQNASSSPVSHTVQVTAPNQPPSAAFTSSCTGLACSFSDQSSDPDGSVTSWQWTFGDGTSGSTAQNPSHTYSAGG